MKHVLFSCALVVSALASADVTFHTGNGMTGDLDTITTFTAVDGSTALTSTDFANARGGTKATIVDPYGGAWTAHPATDDQSNWVAQAADYNGDVTLYAVSFTSPMASGPAFLHLDYLVDDIVGLNDSGLYLNGTLLTGTATHTGSTDFSGDVYFESGDVSSLLVSGTNTLYFETFNTGGGPTGLNASARINAVPEPATTAVLGLGALGLLRRRRH